MSFFSLRFLILIAIAFVIYYLLPREYRYIDLLVTGVIFYASWSVKYVLVLGCVTGFAYVMAIVLEKTDKNHKRLRKSALFIGVAGIAFVLCVFKFWTLIINGIERIWGVENIQNMGIANIIAPIGLSFFSLVAIGYLVDVYKCRIPSEKNFLEFFLFISFFPTIISGPIERGGNLLKQIKEKRAFNQIVVIKGMRMILWGYFIKILIANRLAVIVNETFESYATRSGFVLLVGAILYGFQLYADFSGYSFIAIGLAAVFGYEITENFRRPYFARSIKEFWSRWHISLSTWLRDYIYIPLGGNRKGRVRKYINLFITFLVSGLWHGSGLTYIIWGGLHAVYQIVEDLINNFRLTHNENKRIRVSRCVGLIHVIVTFILVDFAWIFFRSGSIYEAIHYLSRILFHLIDNPSAELFDIVNSFGIGHTVVVVLECVIWIIVDLIHEHGKSVGEYLSRLKGFARWLIYLVACIAILTGIAYDFGTNASNFIYAAF